MIYRILFLSIVLFTSCSSPNNKVNYSHEVKEVISTVFIADSIRDYASERLMEDNMQNRSNLNQLLEIILSKVESKEITVYTPIFHRPMPIAEVNDIFHDHDTISLELPDGSITNTPIESHLRTEDITHLRFKEHWYFSEENGVFQKEVVSVCPMIANFAPNGDYRGATPLFWVRMEDLR